MVEEIIKEIQTRRTEFYSRDTKPRPRNNPIASDLGPCTREMALSIFHWDQRPAFDADTKARLQRGSLIEDAALGELRTLGISARVDRKPFEIKDKQGRIVLRGRVDGFMEHKRKEYPFEIKSMMPFIFQKIDTLEDFNRYWWTAKYPRQVQAYLYANNLEEGFFLLDDLAGHWKLIPIRLDLEEMEKILQQCESTVDHLAKKTLPDFHTDPSVCAKCWARGRVCDPPAMRGEGLQLIPDPELEAKLNRRAELDPAATEYDALDKDIKKSIKGKTNLIVGDWFITGEEKDRKGYEVKASKYWQSKIEKIS